MVTETWRIWTLSNDTTASAYLAVSLFRGVSVILSRFASLGELANVMEILLAAATAVMGACGVLVCLGRDVCNIDASPTGEEYRLPDDDRCARPIFSWEEHAEVNVRLEERYPRPLHRYRCIVMIQGSEKDALEKGQEAWHVGGDYER
jgi:hypothetical protein